MTHHRFDASNTIPASCSIGPEVRLGTGNVFGEYCVLTGDIRIGDGNWFGSHVVIGGPAQLSNKKVELEPEKRRAGIRIGNRNVIREHCSIDHPSMTETIITGDCYIMEGCYISHDSLLAEGCILSAGTKLGGFAFIGTRANLGLATLVHQFSSIGAFAMVGMGSVIVRDIPPFSKVVGNPARLLGTNSVGMQRNGFSDEEIRSVSDFLAGNTPQIAESVRDRFVEIQERSHEHGRRGLLDRIV